MKRMLAAICAALMLAVPALADTVVFENLHYGAEAYEMHLNNETNTIVFNGETYSLDDDAVSFKEAFSEDYYASHANVSADSVTMVQAPAPLGGEFSNEVIRYCATHDMTQKENYDYLCSVVDMDSLIDWAIIEGYSANADVQQNLRYFRSTENGKLWQYAFYDLDWAFYYDINNLGMVLAGIGEDGTELQHSTYIRTLLYNGEFRDRF